MKKALLGSLLLLAVLPFSAQAQSLFSTRGLGIPLANVDARAHGLGVNGVGLAGLSTSLLNPAEAGGTLRRGISATFQPWSGKADINGNSGSVSGTRFPLLSVLYPVGRVTLSLGFVGDLDQSWAVITNDTTNLGSDTVPTRDVVRSRGGIGELKVGAAFMLNERLSIGGQLGVYTGGLERTTRREFPDSSLFAFDTRERWDYTGPVASLGIRFDPISKARIGASVTWSGTLEARPKEGNDAVLYKYDMPLRVALGASGFISPRLLFAASTTINNYGSGTYTTAGTTVQAAAQRTVDFGGGLEWQELRSGDRIFPLRAGFRMTHLPFRNPGEAAATEKAFTGGLGLRLVEDEYGPLAVADIGVERGKRDGWSSSTLPGGLKENFWRFSVSLSLFGR